MLKEINKTIIIPKVITICFITPLLKPIKNYNSYYTPLYDYIIFFTKNLILMIKYYQR